MVVVGHPPSQAVPISAKRCKVWCCPDGRWHPFCWSVLDAFYWLLPLISPVRKSTYLNWTFDFAGVSSPARYTALPSSDAALLLQWLMMAHLIFSELFSLYIVINKFFFIAWDNSFKKWDVFVVSKYCMTLICDMWNISVFSYVMWLWIIFNQHFHLVIINNCKPIKYMYKWHKFQLCVKQNSEKCYELLFQPNRKRIGCKC